MAGAYRGSLTGVETCSRLARYGKQKWECGGETCQVILKGCQVTMVGPLHSTVFAENCLSWQHVEIGEPWNAPVSYGFL